LTLHLLWRWLFQNVPDEVPEWIWAICVSCTVTRTK